MQRLACQPTIAAMAGFAGFCLAGAALHVLVVLSHGPYLPAHRHYLHRGWLEFFASLLDFPRA